MTTELVFKCFRSLEIIIREPAITYGDEGLHFFPNDKELIKAQLLVELIDRCHYPPESIRVNPFFLPVDMAVENGPGRLFCLIKIASIDEYELEKEKAFQILYDAAKECGDERSPRYLAYYTRWYKGKVRLFRYIVVDIDSFPTFKSWQEADYPVIPDFPKWQ